MLATMIRQTPADSVLPSPSYLCSLFDITCTLTHLRRCCHCRHPSTRLIDALCRLRRSQCIDAEPKIEFANLIMIIFLGSFTTFLAWQAENVAIVARHKENWFRSLGVWCVCVCVFGRANLPSCCHIKYRQPNRMRVATVKDDEMKRAQTDVWALLRVCVCVSLLVVRHYPKHRNTIIEVEAKYCCRWKRICSAFATVSNGFAFFSPLQCCTSHSRRHVRHLYTRSSCWPIFTAVFFFHYNMCALVAFVCWTPRPIQWENSFVSRVFSLNFCHSNITEKRRLKSEWSWRAEIKWKIRRFVCRTRAKTKIAFEKIPNRLLRRHPINCISRNAISIWPNAKW